MALHSTKLLLNHKEKHFTAGDLVRNVIMGVSNGLIVPFALAAGLSVAQAPPFLILVAVLAEVTAKSISMGLGGSQDCTIKVWETTQGKLICELKGHGHWVNSLALSAEYTLRTGPFDHTGKTYSSPEEMKAAALERYNKMKGNAPERLG